MRVHLSPLLILPERTFKSVLVLFSNRGVCLLCVQAVGVASAPATALEVINSTIAALETSLGLQPGEGLGTTADDANSTRKGPAGGKAKPPRTKGAGNSSNKKRGEGRCAFYCHM